MIVIGLCVRHFYDDIKYERNVFIRMFVLLYRTLGLARSQPLNSRKCVSRVAGMIYDTVKSSGLQRETKQDHVTNDVSLNPRRRMGGPISARRGVAWGGLRRSTHGLSNRFVLSCLELFTHTLFCSPGRHGVSSNQEHWGTCGDQQGL